MDLTNVTAPIYDGLRIRRESYWFRQPVQAAFSRADGLRRVGNL